MSNPDQTTTSTTREDRLREAKDVLGAVGNASVGLLVLRGVVGILFGLLVLFSPTRATATLTPFIGFVLAFWLITSGVIEIVAAVRSREHFSGWGWDVFFGALAAVAGVVLLFRPVTTGFFFVMLLLWVLALLVLFRSGTLFAQGKVWAIVLGIVYVLLAGGMIYLLVANPAGSVVAIVWVAGIWGLVTGVVSFLLAWRVQSRPT